MERSKEMISEKKIRELSKKWQTISKKLVKNLDNITRPYERETILRKANFYLNFAIELEEAMRNEDSNSLP